MNRSQKILTTALWGLLVLIMVSIIGAGWWRPDRDEHGAGDPATAAPVGSEVLFEVPEFALIDQNNQPATDKTLRGKPWVAAFIFTNCAGPCPMMSTNMAKLQRRVPDANLRLVSFTVDPQRDTPEVLKRYAHSLGADEARWSFFTGSPDAMQRVANGMLMAAKPATETEPILHSTKFLLVDRSGGVRGIYSSDADGMNQLSTHANALAGDAGEAASAAGSSPAPPATP